MKQFFWLLFCALSIIAIPAAAQSDIERISVVAADRTAAAGDIAQNLRHALHQAWPDLTVEITNKENFTPNQTQSTLIIALGDSLLPWLAENNVYYTSAIALYVSSSAFAPYSKKNTKFTALYRDQPLSRQLQLAKLLIPNLHSAAIIRGDRELLENPADLRRNSGIAETPIDIRSEWLKTLSQLMRDNDVLLGIDDAQIYNGDNIRGILLTTYRHGKGLIGPSKAFVNAGSLASCYSSPDQYQQQLVDMVAVALREHRLPHPQYPTLFHVAINKQVATSLNLPIPDENTLSAWLQNQKGECGNGC